VNPQNYDIIVTRGAVYTRTFTARDDAGAPLSLVGYTPVLNVFDGRELRLTSLVRVVGVSSEIELTVEPAGATGVIQARIGSDVIDGLLQPFNEVNLGLHYRLDAIHDALDGGDLAFYYGHFDFGPDL
jgi:hypothetical protein